MNTTYRLYTRPRRRWFITVSVGVHMLALGLLVWWLAPSPVMQTTPETATLSVTLAPASSESIPAVNQDKALGDETVATVDTMEQSAIPVQNAEESTSGADTIDTSPEALASESRTSLYYQLLQSSRTQMEREFAVNPQNRAQRLTSLLNEPLADGTLVGRLQSERNWAGTGDTLVVFDTAFGRLCSRYTEANPLDSLDQGVWRVMFGACYQRN